MYRIAYTEDTDLGYPPPLPGKDWGELTPEEEASLHREYSTLEEAREAVASLNKEATASGYYPAWEYFLTE